MARLRVLRAGSLRSHRSFIPGGGPASSCSDVLALRAADYGTRGSGASCVYGLAGAGRVVAALGEHRCARSRAFAWRVRRCARSRTWGACGAPLRPRFGLICLEPISVHPPCCVKRVHERHESPFFGQILTLVYTFWVRRCVGSNLSLVAEKSPSRVTGTGYERLWLRGGFGAPLHAAVRCGRSRGHACFAGKRSAFPQFRTFTGFEFLIRCRKKPASQRNAGLAFTMAEREGFEPSRRSRAQRFSRPPHSTALPSLRGR